MPVSDPNFVDAVGLDRLTQEVCLTLTEHRDWSECERQLKELVAKIEAYLVFVESGQLLEHDPSYKGKPVRFDLYCKELPPDNVKGYFSKLKADLQLRGILLVVKFRNDDGSLSCLETQ